MPKSPWSLSRAVPWIINADDFGKSAGVNRAIVASFQAGWCSSTTIMANGAAFAEACQLAHEHRLCGRIGVHLVLTEGSPLTDAIRRFPRFCDREGRFCLSRRKPLFRLETAERQAVAAELAAQIDRCRSQGLPLTHADSHHHCHTEWAIFALLRVIAADRRIRFCRLTRNCGGGIDLPRRLYKAILNRRIRRAGLAGTDYFGSVRDVLELLRNNRAGYSAELMVHPDFDNEGHVRDSGDNDRLDELLAGVPDYQRAISYGELLPREVLP